MNVLVIPEDFRKDQYILKPIVEAMMASVGKLTATVVICKDPLLGGVSQALNWSQIAVILERYMGMVDLFLLCVDRDGKSGRRGSLDAIEQRSKERLPEGKILIGAHAIEELEVWLLAGHDLEKGWNWKFIRQEVNPKETYYIPFARQKGMLDHPYEGRKLLGIEAAKRYKRIVRLCPEDVKALEMQIRQWIKGKTV